MSVNSIVLAPTLNAYLPVYRPILYQVQTLHLDRTDPTATGIDVEVCCDVYCDGEYYRTVSSNTPVPSSIIDPTQDIWEFDIQGVLQDYIRTIYPYFFFEEYKIAYKDPSSAIIYRNGMVNVSVMFRSYLKDNTGTLTYQDPSDTAPVQGTVDTPPESGYSPVYSDAFYGVYASLQYPDNLLDFTQYLQGKKLNNIDGTLGDPYWFPTIDTDCNVYQLAVMARQTNFFNDYDSLPIIFMNGCFYSSYITHHDLGEHTGDCVLVVFTFDNSGAFIAKDECQLRTLIDNRIVYYGVGIPQLISDAVDPTTMQTHLESCSNYYVALFQKSLIHSTTLYNHIPLWRSHYIYKAGIGLSSDTQEHLNIWFQNYLGHYTPIRFRVRRDDYETKSGRAEAPPTDSDFNIKRIQTTANTITYGTEVFEESEVPRLNELFSSANVFMEVPAPDNPTNSRLAPVIVKDKKVARKEFFKRFFYEYTIEVEFSNKYIIPA